MKANGLYVLVSVHFIVITVFSFKQNITTWPDLDETLISIQTIKDFDYSSSSKYFNYFKCSQNEVYCLKTRPYLDYFLNEVLKFFELHIMTNSTKSYCSKVLL